MLTLDATRCKIITEGAQCVNRRHARGMCPAHYERWKEWGDPRSDLPLRRHPSRNPIAPGYGWCSKCVQELPLTEFPPVKKERAGQWCSECQWRMYLRSYYQIADDWYERTLESQNGVCATCLQVETKLDWCGRPVRFAVDHDHNCCPGAKSCGKCLRGLLCHRCNRALGLIYDNPEIADALAVYLRQWANEVTHG